MGPLASATPHAILSNRLEGGPLNGVSGWDSNASESVSTRDKRVAVRIKWATCPPDEAGGRLEMLTCLGMCGGVKKRKEMSDLPENGEEEDLKSRASETSETHV